MSLEGKAKRVRFYVHQGDLIGHTQAWVAIVNFLRKEDAAGATVFRGCEGFGGSGQIHTERWIDLVGPLPFVVEWIDSAERVEALLGQLKAMLGRGFITVEDTYVAMYEPRRVREVSRRLRAEDVMSREVASVAADASLREVVECMHERGYRAVPVVEQGTLIGIIANSDLVVRGDLSVRLDLLPALRKSELEIELERLGTTPLKARDIMTPAPATVHAKTTLPDVAALMIERRLKRLPVLDERERLVGMIGRLDLLRTVARAFSGDDSQPRDIGLNSDLPVSRVMRRDVPSVYPDTPVSEVMQAVVSTRLNRALVVDRDGRVLGLITDSELLERVTPSIRPSVVHSLMRRLPFVQPKPAQQRLEQHARATTASDLMSTDVTIVNETEPLRSAIVPMLQGKQKLVAIVDASQHLVGVLDRADILRGLLAASRAGQS